jgi:hypothetical protein
MKSHEISNGERDWNKITVDTLRHVEKYGITFTEDFRRFGNAEAWLEWESHCTIKKLETLKPRSGAASLLLSKLKELADRHGFLIFANVSSYATGVPENLLSQTELEEWYVRQGFDVYSGANGCVFAWYPKRPASAA